MSYTALYRKWRPAVFEEVKGQEHIVAALKNQVVSGRIGHAYLFCGTRGTGKTTVAKILAKAVNCENPQDGSPCNECARCRAIQAGAAVNVVEIDAASNNGVDNIREIREEVKYSPADGRYRVYIIDEVHMLSTGAFNALLKTLEEPPSYVIFILATTEVHKIPVTVLSRCQRYDFRRISNETITARLRQLTDGEGAACEERALQYIAKKADGSMRDAISLLDQCMAFYFGQPLTYEKTLDVLGAVDHELFGRLLEAVVNGSTSGCIYLVDEIVMQGRELNQLVTDFIWYLRNLMLLKASDMEADALELSAEEVGRLASFAVAMDHSQIMRYIRVLSELSSRIRYGAGTDKRVLLELTLIRLCTPSMDQNTDALMQRIEALERKWESGAVAVVREPAAAGQVGTPDDRSGLPPADGKQEAAENAAYGTEPEKMPEESGLGRGQVVHTSAEQKKNLDALAADWPEIVGRLKMAARAALKNTYVTLKKGGDFEIIFARPEDLLVGNRPAVMEQLKQAVQERCGQQVTFCARLEQPGETKDSIRYITDEEIQNVFNIEVTKE